MSTTNAFDNVEILQSFIVFQFEDEVDRGNRNAFHEKSDGGIVLQSSFDEGTKRPRWATAIKVGPEVCEDIQVGTKILITPMMWTRISSYNGERFARTEERHVLAVED